MRVLWFNNLSSKEQQIKSRVDGDGGMLLLLR